jgi:transcriptional regulator with XRE-family HTH domain
MPALATARLDSERVFEQLDRERRRRRMTRKELCAEIGVTGSSYCSWSRGCGISGSALARVAEWLDIDVRDYLKQPENELGPRSAESEGQNSSDHPVAKLRKVSINLS